MSHLSGETLWDTPHLRHPSVSPPRWDTGVQFRLRKGILFLFYAIGINECENVNQGIFLWIFVPRSFFSWHNFSIIIYSDCCTSSLLSPGKLLNHKKHNIFIHLAFAFMSLPILFSAVHTIKDCQLEKNQNYLGFLQWKGRNLGQNSTCWSNIPHMHNSFCAETHFT